MLMTQQQALEILAKHRGDAVVITTMSAVGLWPNISDTAKDFAYLPSSMGQGPPLALGLALSQPEQRFILVNGDGCMLMNLGTLVTLAQFALPLHVIVMENGIYEVTGGQTTAGGQRLDLPGMALAAGFSRVYHCQSHEEWEAQAAEALTGDGPVFIGLKVEARYGQQTPKPPRPMSEQIVRLRQALGVN